MMKFIRDFGKKQDGLGTVEIIIIVAILIAIALIFKGQITAFVTNLSGQVFSNDVSNSITNGIK